MLDSRWIQDGKRELPCLQIDEDYGYKEGTGRKEAVSCSEAHYNDNSLPSFSLAFWFPISSTTGVFLGLGFAVSRICITYASSWPVTAQEAVSSPGP